ncbi:hypothetical protein A3Q56_04424 [Intoshia linei]|uniref:Diphthine--ammonia ligase n=1 Tax=Intoshia linei TaxID=1819745 RepID=A0A177B0J3_9BILA|nr:hypothetical protein A3Q56_04424 [Intoshia linei]
MEAVALVSGGKDSTFNIMKCLELKPEVKIVALANLYPPHDPEDDISSYMYQTVGHELIDLYGQAMGIPLYRAPISGSAVDKNLNYTPNDKDEVEDMYKLIKDITIKHPKIKYVLAGAIQSRYQTFRVRDVYVLYY